MLLKSLYRFCSLKRYNFQDILMLQRFSQEESKNLNLKQEVLYFYFHSKKVFFKGEGTVLELQQAIKKQIDDVKSVGVFQQTTNDEQIEYASSTPMQLVLAEDMILRLNQTERYIILNKVDNPPVIDLIDNYPITQHALHENFQEIDVPQRTKVVLSNFIQKLLSEIEKHKELTYDKDLILLIIKKVIMKLGIYSQAQKQIIEDQISFLECKQNRLAHLKDSIIKELEMKEQTTLYQIYFYILMQIAFTQYGTYVVWGWDVMEPVTFMLGVTDMIIAYQFWMKTTKAYTFGNVLQNAVNKHLNKKLSEQFNYAEELNDVNRMIEYLKFKQMVYSSDIYEVISVIEGAIEEKQAKLQAQEEEEQ
ncbi:unnamed protein product [Paramecium sonneborni]|uniref:Calcium uniporter protein C-terminal domain-containing protein n=1 Tax=Paramecium sonneborni TaxID=65129 RepID=A0A8S1R2H3_9CILI|nr:unnamed protein product [Paramecium sonneborni]